MATNQATDPDYPHCRQLLVYVCSQKQGNRSVVWQLRLFARTVLCTIPSHTHSLSRAHVCVQPTVCHSLIIALFRRGWRIPTGPPFSLLVSRRREKWAKHTPHSSTDFKAGIEPDRRCAGIAFAHLSARTRRSYCAASKPRIRASGTVTRL
jgi:hypothetical protein